MKKRAKAAIVISSVILFLMALSSFVYFVLFDTFTLFSDVSFNQVYSTCLLRDRLRYAARGVRLKVRTIDDTCFNDNERFISELAGVRGDYVLLSPIASMFAYQNRTDVSALVPGSIVLGIGSEDYSGLFDNLLVSDERSGWVKAGKAISAETASMSQNIGLVYDLGSIDYDSDIVGCFGENRVSIFAKDGSGRLFASTTLETMNRQGIVVALCPFATNFDSFFNFESSVSWVVDYRLAPVVPDKNLYGVVCPDLGQVLETARSTHKGLNAMGRLEYRYEKN
ncbi:MAG: hypothetical protein IJ863_09195 [Spirochaetales bacterium]|nr:hypothetical protein [Spirochaetales bacterium]